MRKAMVKFELQTRERSSIEHGGPKGVWESEIGGYNDSHCSALELQGGALSSLSGKNTSER